MLTPEMEAAYQESVRRIEQSYNDSSYQTKLAQYYSMIEKANERYSVLNTLNLFMSDQALALIELCTECIELEAEIKTKREYYENHIFDMSPPYKMLAMIYDKRGDYEKVVSTCMQAIKNGYPADNTKGGMRGRMAKALKRGKIEITDEIKAVLGI